MNEKDIDNIAREIYQQRSQSPREMTDERWARIKRIFPASYRDCREAALRMIEDGEFDE